MITSLMALVVPMLIPALTGAIPGLIISTIKAFGGAKQVANIAKSAVQAVEKKTVATTQVASRDVPVQLPGGQVVQVKPATPAPPAAPATSAAA